jgi:hypothetical protein
MKLYKIDIKILISTLFIILVSTFLGVMHVDVVTQSPFFLYENYIYIFSILIIAFLIFLERRSFSIVFLVSILCALVLLLPFTLYYEFPVYNDQLGFVAETLIGIESGRVSPVQGDWTTLGHAYFTSIFSIIGGFHGLQGVVAVQLTMPVLYLLQLLSLSRGPPFNRALVAVLTLAFLLDPLMYGRGSFVRFFWLLYTVYLYNRMMQDEGGRSSSVIIALIVYIAYAISHPTSVVIPIATAGLALLNRRFIPLALATLLGWAAVNVIFYLSGSFYSLIQQIILLIEQPASPTSVLIISTANPVMKAYNYLREAVVALGFLVGLIATVTVFKSTDKRSKPWTFLYFVFVILQVAALLANRWGMVPYTLYVLGVLPPLVSAALSYGRLKLTLFLLSLLLLLAAPAVKWGASMIFFPALNDIALADYLTSFSSPREQICTSGAHVLTDFYRQLRAVDVSFNAIDPLPIARSAQLEQCKYVAVFYKSFNIYRLDISETQLRDALATLDKNLSIIYRNGLWTTWLK